jgi:D-beta-D-heptose 7-phosphate kinase/D-beta-D-heptose 1-phosphate adenosyltransferase
MGSFKLVLANGCFDILHAGHLMYLEQASKMGDYLMVAVTRDAFVNKGPGRPVNTEQNRLMLIRGLRCVTGAFLCNDSLDALEVARPNIFVKGADYVGKIEQRHSDYCLEKGIEIRFTTTPIYSATKIINDRLRLG